VTGIKHTTVGGSSSEAAHFYCMDQRYAIVLKAQRFTFFFVSYDMFIHTPSYYNGQGEMYVAWWCPMPALAARRLREGTGKRSMRSVGVYRPE